MAVADASLPLVQQIATETHEQVIAFQDEASSLRGFLAIHDTTLGPAHGGTRVWHYQSEQEALADALRLSRAMTYKAALAELPAGGGKGVVLSNAIRKRSEAFEAYGRVVESLGGRFFTGPDVGITEEDLTAVRRSTSHLACHSSPAMGNINEHTAIGVWHGMRACLEFAGLGTARVAIQGVGGVGMELARILKREGVELVVADIDPGRVKQAREKLGAEVVAPEEILTTSCDVLAPCALGGVITPENVSTLRAKVVCGSANNILATPEAGDELTKRGILYAPDYLVNAGGLIRGVEFYLLKRTDSAPSLARIYDRMRRVLEISKKRGGSTGRVADEMAEARLREAKAQS